MDKNVARDAEELARLCVENPDLPVIIIPYEDEDEDFGVFASEMGVAYVGKVLDGDTAYDMYGSVTVGGSRLGDVFHEGFVERSEPIANRIMWHFHDHSDEPDFNRTYRPIAEMMADDLPWFDAVIVVQDM